MTLPAEIGFLPRLTALYVHNNKIDHIPSSFRFVTYAAHTQSHTQHLRSTHTARTQHIRSTYAVTHAAHTQNIHSTYAACED